MRRGPRLSGEITFEEVWDGYGSIERQGDLWALTPKVSTEENETHSAFVLSKERYFCRTLQVEVTNIRQLRKNDPPNPWEVGWVVFGAKDERDFWYAILKTNGMEIGTFDHDIQNFKATSETPVAEIGETYTYNIQFNPHAIAFWVDGGHKLRVPGTPRGRIGFYTEDAAVQFRLLEG
jgi:hypothetical protein